MAAGLPLIDAQKLVAVSFAVGLAIGVIGRVLLDRLRSNRLAVQGLVVIFVAIAATLVGALVAVRLHLVEARAVAVLTVVVVGAATMAVFAGLHLANEVDEASRGLGEVARRIANGDEVEAPSPRAVPEELALLGAELHHMRVSLDAERLRTQRSEQSRRELIAWMSHDLRTPLTRLHALVAVLDDGAIADPVALDRYHRTMYLEIQRLETVIDDLVELSRFDGGPSVPERAPDGVFDLVYDGTTRESHPHR
jgi:signal transduction histidine kinase